MKKTLILLALLVTLQLLVGDIASWQDCYVSSVEQLQMIRQSAGTIYGVGYKYFVKSSNGSDFQNIMVADCDSLVLESAWMISSSVGYCGGQIYRPSDSSLSRPVLYKTTNGGQSWTRTGQLEQQTARYIVSNVQFVSQQEGYIALNPYFGFDGLKIYRTVNGGQSWSLVYGPSYGNCLASDFSPGLMIVGKNSPQGVLISANGTDWQLRTDNIVGQNPTLVLSNNGRLIVKTYPYMLYSDNTGQDWSTVDFTNLGDGFSPAGCLTSCAMSALGSNVYMIAGIWDGSSNHRGIIRSLNNGSDWQWIVQPADMPDQSGQTYGICYWGEYVYIAHNLHIYRMHVGPVANDDPTIPVVTDNLNCYPNPFRGSTNVIIKQIDNSPTTVAVYNLRGQLIRTVVNNLKLSPGEHSFVWDGKSDNGQPVAAGIYFFKITSGKYSATRKIVLMK